LVLEICMWHCTLGGVFKTQVIHETPSAKPKGKSHHLTIFSKKLSSLWQNILKKI
jgi:hypothetical protein